MLLIVSASWGGCWGGGTLANCFLKLQPRESWMNVMEGALENGG